MGATVIQRGLAGKRVARTSDHRAHRRARRARRYGVMRRAVASAMKRMRVAILHRSASGTIGLRRPACGDRPATTCPRCPELAPIGAPRPASRRRCDPTGDACVRSTTAQAPSIAPRSTTLPISQRRQPGERPWETGARSRQPVRSDGNQVGSGGVLPPKASI
jgi:hypothetical protein